LRISHIE